jgi:hypothetical protein
MVALLLLVAILAPRTDGSRGAECYPWPTSPAASADLAILAVVQSIHEIGHRPAGTEIKITFGVLHSWHGAPDDPVVVYGVRHPEGLPVTSIGEHWLVIANRDEGDRLWGSGCAGSTGFRSLRDGNLRTMLHRLGLSLPRGIQIHRT